MIFKIGLYETGGKKAAADPFTKISSQFRTVVNFKRKLIKGRKKLPDKLTYFLKGKITEKVIELGKVCFGDPFLIMVMGL